MRLIPEALGGTERSEVMWGTTRIRYQVRRSARRRTVSLAIDPGLGLVVTAPEGTGVDRLDSIVRGKAEWVVEHLRRSSDLPPPLPAREFVSGEGFWYLGKQLRLRVIVGRSPGPIALRGGWLELPMLSDVPEEARPRVARAALIDWYRRRGEERLPEEVRRWAGKLDLNAPSVLIADQEKRWGSCSLGVVRLNWRVLQAPKRLIEYVAAHEVVHLIHEDHSRAFWATLGRLLPDYESRKAALREMGPKMVW